MGIKGRITSNPTLKKFIHWTLVPTKQAKPRTWVKLLVNPFFHQKKNGSIIRRRTRMDIFPFNNFVLGKNAVIEDFCTINNGVGAVVIGDETTLGMGNVLIGPITIGKNVIVAQNVVMSGLNHNYKDVTKAIQLQGVKTAPIVVGDDCWIGANVVITAGTSIGKHCVIAAGAVVTKDVPNFCIAAGNPAKIIKKYDATQQSWVKVN